jgi:WD40 repeat protein/serine/threonine protein kinase
MSAAEPKVRELSAQDRQKLDELLGEFHRTWAAGRLDAALAELPADLPYRLAAVTGLAALDLEMQWQAGNRPRVEDYLEKYPELGTAENVSIELLLAEYLAMERADPAAPPDLSAFLSRFPQQADEFRRLIALARSPRLSGVRTRISGSTSIHSQTADEGPSLPEQFDRYRIQKRLGHGGMGTVYLAYDTRLDRKVALKVPKFAPGSNPENLERFYREARATATITHPNLCPLYDVGEINGTPYLTMAYIEGWPLSKFIRPDKLLPQFGVATVVRIVAQAIDEAHKRGVIHRDLKPGNIMINKRGEPIVMDFGLARWVNADKEDVRLTRSGAILGAPVYMSPEQVYGDVDAMGPGCDVYSLGVILYELLTGRLPFEGPTTAVLAKTLIQPPKPPSAYRPDVDPRLEAICLKAMAKKIEDRYQSMGELAAELTEYIRAERQAQTLTSLSATQMPGNGAQSSSSVNVGGAKSGRLPAGGSSSKSAPSSKSARRRKEALTTTVSAGKGPTHPDIGDGPDVIGGADKDVLSMADVLAKPASGGRLVLLLALGGAGMLAALLFVGVLAWALWPRSAPTPVPGASAAAEGSLRIALSETPEDVEVRVDGDLIGRDRLAAPLKLKAGEHRVEVRSGKFEPWAQTVRVGGGDNPPLEVMLRPRDVARGPEPTPGKPFAGHSGAVKAVAWSGDGRHVLSGGEDFTVRLWDAATRQVTHHFDGHTRPVTSVALSEDGTRALSGDAAGTVIQWDVPGGKELRRLPGHTDWVRGVAVSRDGRWGLSAGDDGSVRLWDLDSGALLKVFTGHAGKVWCVALSRDGKRAASGGEDRTVRVWDLEKRAEMKQLTGHTADVRCLTFLTDGRLLSGSDDHTLRLWDPAKSATEVKRFVGHAGKVRGVAVTSDGKRAVSASFGDGDNTVRVWDVAKGTLQHGLGSAPQGLNAVALAPNDRWVVTGGDDRLIQLWDINKPSPDVLPSPPAGERVLEVRRFGAPKHEIDRVAVSHDGHFALSAGYDGTVRYWDLSNGGELRSIDAHPKGVRYVVFSADDKQALSCGEDRRACLWDLATGRLVKAYEGHAAVVWCAIFTPDGTGVFTSAGNDDNKARLFDAATGELRKEYKGHTRAINALAVSPDGKRLVTAGWDSTLRVWDVDEAKELHSFKAPSGNFASVAFLPDGRRVVAANAAKAKLYDVYDFKDLRTFDGGHTQSVWFVAVSPGGRRLITSGQDSHICLWDIENGKLIHKYTGNPGSVPGLAFTPDGTRFLSGGRDNRDPASRLWDTLRLWELPRDQYDPPPLPADRATKEARLLQAPVQAQPRAPYVEQVAFTADGKRALWSGDDKAVHVWDLAQNKELLKFDKHTEGVRSFAILPDGKRVLSAGYDRRLRLWEIDTGKQVRQFPESGKRLMTVAVTSDGKRAVSGGDDPELTVWNVDTGTEVRKLTGHEKAVYAVAVTPDGREAISGSMDKTIRRWDLETGQEIAKWTAPHDVHTVAVSPDGRRVLSGGKDKGVSLWDRETGELLAAFPGHTNNVTCVRFSPDGRWALSAGGDNSVRLWNLETGQEVARNVASAAGTKGVAFAPDGRSALFGSADSSVRLWELPEFAATVPVGSLRTFAPAADKLDRVAVSPDGKLALSAGYDGKVRQWDVEAGTEAKAYDWHTGAVHYVSFSPDGRRAASGAADKTAVVWDVDGGALVRRFNHNSAVWGAVFSPDGKRLLTCCEDGSAAVWDVDSGESVQTFKGHTKRVNAAAWTTDGARVVTAGIDKVAKLWDVTTGKELKQYQGHTDGVATVAVSPNGRWIVTGGYDGTVRLWDLESKECLHVFEGHAEQVWNVAFSPDGRRILSGSKDKTVKLWDVERRQLLWNYTGHKDGVTGVAFHPDGRRAISSSMDKTLRLWGLPPVY